MKKLIFLLAVVVAITSLGLVLSFGDEEALHGENAAQNQYIKVGLRYGDSEQTTAVLKSSGGFLIGRIDGNGIFINTLPLPAYPEIVASVEGSRVVLKDADGVMLSQDFDGNSCLAPYEENGSISFDGRKYRGCMSLKTFGGNKVTVINVLPLEEYLYGVVHREIGMRSPAEALKAQAITARTYAMLNLNRHRTNGFDICAGTHCQVYGGMNDEYESTINAVDETRGIMIYVDGKPVETYYSKNSGGHTQNSEDVWANRLSHLRGKPDPYCPDYPWHATMTYDVLRQKLKQGGVDPGNINKIWISGRNSSLAVESLTISGDLGDVVLTRTKIRELLGASLIRSTHFTLNEEYVRPAGSPGSDTFSISTKETAVDTSADSKVYVLGSQGEAKSMQLGKTWVKSDSCYSALSDYIVESKPGQFSDKPVVGGNTITFYGLGYGHGVGMAQDGAIEMANRGMSYLDILTFYYTGVEVY